ncbi:MAG: hypothetical protein M3N57_08460 [Actinomycetota bacterium]|nr:hypothetical protein [Actinomycetota bacterium]
MRIYLVHWNADEAEQLAGDLRTQGHDVAVEAEDGARAAHRIFEDPPDAVVISLRRLPSHGRDVAVHVRSRSDAPIIFVDGDPEKVDATADAVPDAVHVSWDELSSQLR